MNLKFLFGFLPLLKAATAAVEDGYLVPADTVPGVYVVRFGDDGNTTTTRIDIDIGPLTANLSPPAKRSLLSTGSAKFARQLERRLSSGKTNYINAPNGVCGREITYMFTSDLILAVCNYDRTVVFMPGQAVDDFNEIMDGNYGYWETGWVHMGDLYGDVTFWRDWRGFRICSNLNGGYVGK
ncbi:hypothetical protein B0T18DRAFT_431719 [Schizothecium vesticola]|uniref:Uncharacterized protein n=1 Tax=Schizothecium vesticola TaxID=314040 RepID=A0AA40EJB5_9PEZI|nr:hypothetical protein B0T18DRAFT_431719 [Schizothecium vesticola]